LTCAKKLLVFGEQFLRRIRIFLVGDLKVQNDLAPISARF